MYTFCILFGLHYNSTVPHGCMPTHTQTHTHTEGLLSYYYYRAIIVVLAQMTEVIITG